MTKAELMEKMRADLKAFDDARYGLMMKVWAKVSDSPQKAAGLAVVLFIAGLILGAIFL